MERSLERYPWSTLSDSRGDLREIKLLFDDGRAWIVTPHGKERLPGPFAADLWLAVALRYNQLGRPEPAQVALSYAELLRLMHRTPSGSTYDAVDSALRQLEAVRIVAVETWRKGQSVTLRLCKVRKDHRNAIVTFSDEIAGAFRAGEIRLLDMDVYLSLPTPTARRLYRYLDYRRWKGKEQHFEVALPLLQVAAELPIQRSAPSLVLRTLEPAHQALIDQGVLIGAQVTEVDRFGLRRGEHWVHYRFPKRLVAAPKGLTLVDDIDEKIAHIVDTIGGGARNRAWYVKVARALPLDMLLNILGGVREYTADPAVAQKVFTSTVKSRAKAAGIDL